MSSALHTNYAARDEETTAGVEYNAADTLRPPVQHRAGFYEGLFFRALQDVSDGGLDVVFPDGSARRIGRADDADPAVMEVLDPIFFRHSVLYGEVGFGEAYVEGWWDSPDVLKALSFFMRNSDQAPTFSRSLFKGLFVAPLGFLNRIAYSLRPNTKHMARKNISEHYDLSNDFFQLWLDETMAYSSGVFEREDTTLHESQLAKFEMIARKLQLSSTDHVLEIGCGWGGFAVYAAKKFGCRVTGITISEEQYELARTRVRSEGLEHRIDIQFCDYRDIRGRYDKIVSIEMVEALGYRFLDTFFRRCNELLADDGIMVIQCITFPEPYYRRYMNSTDYTKKHIFPGSLLLSLRETMQSLGRTGDLCIFDVESIGRHYARTLREWRHNFEAALDQVRALGFDERFIRKWRYYLLFCECGFGHNYINDVQIQFARTQNLKLRNYVHVPRP